MNTIISIYVPACQRLETSVHVLAELLPLFVQLLWHFQSQHAQKLFPRPLFS